MLGDVLGCENTKTHIIGGRKTHNQQAIKDLKNPWQKLHIENTCACV
jgi:hypothetical protein